MPGNNIYQWCELTADIHMNRDKQKSTEECNVDENEKIYCKSVTTLKMY